MVYYSAEMCIDTLRYILLLYNASVLLSRAFFIFVGMPLKHGLFRFFFVNLHKPDGTAADSKGNTAQSPPDGFARNLCADFPSYCPEIPCHTAVCLRNF